MPPIPDKTKVNDSAKLGLLILNASGRMPWRVVGHFGHGHFARHLDDSGQDARVKMSDTIAKW